MTSKTWLITGCTSGLGLTLAQRAASRGDRVLASGRNATARLAYLASSHPTITPLDLDLVEPLASLKTKIDDALRRTGGRIDILVNNAGRVVPTTIEEASEETVQKNFDVNLFGAIKATQAVLPHMRAARQGTVAFISSGMAWGPPAFINFNAVSKAALSAFAEGLEKEVSPFGIHSIVFELGGFSTETVKAQGEESGGTGPASAEEKQRAIAALMPKIDDYVAPFSAFMAGFAREVKRDKPGDMDRLPDVIIDVIKSEGVAAGRALPVRVALGSDSQAVVRQKCRQQLELCDEWDDVAVAATKSGRGTADFVLKVTSLPRH